ncbi:DUF4377 domain-containing protein [Deinococcus sp.]|uniref:DUF4377 domain-containing protein n=1 Tax=Deinococcus sp. TaxID=47478 RepID=UPI003B58E52E
MKMFAFSLVAALALSGCSTTTPKDVRVLYVAPNTAPCTGNGPRTCFLTKENEMGKWQFFYDGIVGFSYEPGYRYKLSVEVTPVANPPADAPNANYTLLNILEKAEDSTLAVINQ